MPIRKVNGKKKYYVMAKEVSWWTFYWPELLVLVIFTAILVASALDIISRDKSCPKKESCDVGQNH